MGGVLALGQAFQDADVVTFADGELRCAFLMKSALLRARRTHGLANKRSCGWSAAYLIR